MIPSLAQIELRTKLLKIERKLENMPEGKYEEFLKMMEEEGPKLESSFSLGGLANKLGISLEEFVKLPNYEQVKADLHNEIVLEFTKKASDPFKEYGLEREDVLAILQAGANGLLDD